MSEIKVNIKQVNNLGELESRQLETALETYIGAFAKLPYLELFSREESLEALQYILDKDGDLLIGQQGEDNVVSLAGGYMDGNTYFIEELAVKQSEQGKGIGKQTLLELLDLGNKRNPKRYELRTNVDNANALSLYKKEGFAQLPTTIVVPKMRVDGRPALDERVYLAKGEPMKEQSQLRRVIIAYPSGNTTALVFDQRLSDDRPDLRNKIRSVWGGQEIEQCGFITLPKDKRAIGRLQMFEDEFCGNGGRSAVWAISGGKDDSGLIEISGVDRPLKYSVNQGNVTLEMPLPDNRSSMIQQVTEGTLVRLKGIAQLVVTNPGSKSPRELLLELFRDNRYGLADEPAFGVTYYDKQTCQAQFCVKVSGDENNGTVFDETACGSGTCAIGVALATSQNRSQNLNVIQPSGESISTQAEYRGGDITSSSITGKVTILYDGPLTL